MHALQQSGFVNLCGGRVWIVLCICVGFVGGGCVRIVLSIFVEVLGSTRSLVVFFVVLVFYVFVGGVVPILCLSGFVF